MDTANRIAMLGVGYCVPDTIRTNDDPVFDWLNAHRPPNTDLFTGLKQRRVLKDPEDVIAIMVSAANHALSDAQKMPGDIDLLIGAASVGQYSAPNGLAAVHSALKLSAKCRIIALNTEYTNFHDGMKLSHDLLQVGTATNALVVCGCNWTHHVDYHESVALAASDGAGAAIVGWTANKTKFRLVDWENETQSEWFGALRMAQRPINPAMNGPAKDGSADTGAFSLPLMKLDDERGGSAVKQFGVPIPAVVVNRLLERNRLQASDITLIAHQTSKFVYDAWNQTIQPGQYISTLEELGDMVSASVPVNLARCFADIQRDQLVLLGIGMEMRATALYYARNMH